MNLINEQIIDVPFTSKPKSTKAGYKRKKKHNGCVKVLLFSFQNKVVFF